MKPGFSTAPDWIRELGFGAGMGLPNIEKNSGQFEIDSEPGKGTRLKSTIHWNSSQTAEDSNGSKPAAKPDEDKIGANVNGLLSDYRT
jgi:hypothetical protein